MADHYVAMGSSYAAGPWIGERAPGSPKAAGRSSINYAHLVARDLALDLHDVTYSGETVAGMLRGPDPQIAAVSPETRLVTVTGGGNDVGYAPRILLGSLPFPLSLLARRRRRAFDDPEQTAARFTALEADLTELVRQVQRRAPEARVALVEYLPVLPLDAATPIGRFPRDLADWGRAAYARLSEVTRTVASRTDAVFVATAEAGAAHHAWSADPWTRRLQLPRHIGAPYHPNAAGMRAVADLVERALA